FAIEGRDAGLTVKLNTALYEVRNDVTKGSGDLEYRYVSPEGVAVAKTFHFSNEYLFTFAVSVSPPMPYRLAIGPGIRTLEPDEKDSQFTVTGNGVVQRDDDLKVIRREKSDRINVYEAV